MALFLLDDCPGIGAPAVRSASRRAHPEKRRPEGTNLTTIFFRSRLVVLVAMNHFHGKAGVGWMLRTAQSGE
jgi:hypothetical protein